MNGQIITTLVLKDLTLFVRNRFFAIVTALGLLAYAGIYFAMPATPEEDLTLAIYAPEISPALIAELEAPNLIVLPIPESAEALQAAVRAGDAAVGVVLSDDTLPRLAAGQPARIDVYYTPDLPQEVADVFTTLVGMAFNNVSYTLTGRPLRIQVHEEVLGPDLLGQPMAFRERLLPLFVVLILITETMGLSSLLTEEIEGRTLRPLLATPATIGDLFLGKGITGVALAFIPAALLLAVTGGLQTQPLLLLAALLFGALLVTGVGFLIAAAARDLLSVLGWGILAVILLSLPALTVLLPGATTSWVRLIPSYYLIDTVNQVLHFGAVWADARASLLILLVSGLVLLWLGTAVLRRKLG